MIHSKSQDKSQVSEQGSSCMAPKRQLPNEFGMTHILEPVNVR